MNDDELREILGLDPDPNLSAEERRALVERVRAAEDAALDRVLDLARVEVPEGLAARVRGAVASERTARRGRRTVLRLVGGGMLAAAAAWALVALGPERAGQDPAAVDPQVASALEAPPDELLAALPELEQLDVLMELEPFEADVLLMFDAEDELLMELLDGNG